MKRDDVILVRGGGDLATGTIHRLWSAGKCSCSRQSILPPSAARSR